MVPLTRRACAALSLYLALFKRRPDSFGVPFHRVAIGGAKRVPHIYDVNLERAMSASGYRTASRTARRKAGIRPRFDDARHTFGDPTRRKFLGLRGNNSATRRACQPQDAQSLYRCSRPAVRHFDPRIASRGPISPKQKKSWGTKLAHTTRQPLRPRVVTYVAGTCVTYVSGPDPGRTDFVWLPGPDSNQRPDG
jgi:hypothetical protein